MSLESTGILTTMKSSDLAAHYLVRPWLRGPLRESAKAVAFHSHGLMPASCVAVVVRGVLERQHDRELQGLCSLLRRCAHEAASCKEVHAGFH